MPDPGAAGDTALTATDARVAAAVRAAHLPSLLAALAHTTGDLSLLRDDLRPDPARSREPHGGLSREQRAAGRELAVRVIASLGEVEGVPRRDRETIRQVMAFTLGGAVAEDYPDLLIEELGVADEDLRAPDWHRDDIDAARDFRVAIVGAGMSGLVAAHRLQQAGVAYVVLEKNPEVGGTWLENRYPGCRVDVPNHLYSYSFAQRDDWPERFSGRDVLLDYFRLCADEFGLRANIRFGVEVVSAQYREEPGDWEVELRTPDGATETLTAHALISAVGQLNRPSVPDIAGRNTFSGPSFHSAQWDHDVAITGKRVAVIGTGASGIQLIPAIADDVAELYVFQRTPNWFMPTPDYHDRMPDELQWLVKRVPCYALWYRFSLFWRLAEGALPAARVDANWPGSEQSISALNDDLRKLLTGYLEAQFADVPELLDEVTPRYPPLAKRILLDDGTWARTLKRDDVHLVTEPIERITPNGIITSDGHEREVDVIVYATGFRASQFLAPMTIVGRDRTALHEFWAGDARAYLGITIPGFPNLFCLYGPNTNLVANGSIIFFSECEVSYILGCIRLLLQRNLRALDCRPDVFEHYNRLIDEGNRQMAWGAATVNSWYKNATGRVSQNWPFSLLEFWQRTRQPDPADYQLV